MKYYYSFIINDRPINYTKANVTFVLIIIIIIISCSIDYYLSYLLFFTLIVNLFITVKKILL